LTDHQKLNKFINLKYKNLAGAVTSKKKVWNNL
jgi:hypothetical protein